jgi:hypothetical protein
MEQKSKRTGLTDEQTIRLMDCENQEIAVNKQLLRLWIPEVRATIEIRKW